MKRKEFIVKTSMGCAAIVLGLPGCSPYVQIQKSVVNQEIRLFPAEFLKKDGTDYHRFVLLRVSGLDYPIVVYREDADTYRSLLLRCTHQGTELNVFGDLISCPAHGSEFTGDGRVLNGPAEEPLRTFETSRKEDEIIIKLA